MLIKVFRQSKWHHQYMDKVINTVIILETLLFSKNCKDILWYVQ